MIMTQQQIIDIYNTNQNSSEIKRCFFNLLLKDLDFLNFSLIVLGRLFQILGPTIFIDLPVLFKLVLLRKKLVFATLRVKKE